MRLDRTPRCPGRPASRTRLIAYQGEITRIKARFDYAGLYVWHCHIVEHEDNEMMGRIASDKWRTTKAKATLDRAGWLCSFLSVVWLARVQWDLLIGFRRGWG